MFGSTNTSFGQSSSSPFGSQSVFGQASNNTSTNPFAPKPFGSTNAFGSQTGSSTFGGTSTGVFGQPSTPAFGASSAPAFGSSTPAFGASSTPAFGSSLFGQKTAFGSFGSSSSQSSPFGSATQQTQPAFGSNLFGSTSPFGASSQPAFGATPSFGSVTTPSFGATSSPAFGATNTPAFGSTATPTFGSTSSTPAFGSTTTPVFGSTGTSFGVSSTPAFGSSVTPSFGATSAAAFGSSSTPAFGASTAPTFGSPTVPAFGASSTPSFSFNSAPSFGQSSPAFGSTQIGTPSSPFGAQSSAFGAQAATPAFGSPGFGQTSFGGQAGGTRITNYNPTPEADGATGTQPAGKLHSIAAMPAYKDKSHEELRWEDYQRGDKGGPNPSAQPTGGIGSNTASQPSPFGTTSTFGQSAANPFSSVASNPFAPKPQGFGASSPSLFSSTFTGSSSATFGSTPATSPLFGSSTVSAFGSSPSPFGSTAPSFTSSSIFGSSLSGSSPPFGALGNTQSSGLFQSSAPSFPQTSPFGQSSTGFQQTASAFGSNVLNSQSTGFSGGLFSSTTPFQTSTASAFGQAAASIQTPFAPQTSNAFSFTNAGQSQPASFSGIASSNIFSPGNISQPPATQSSVVMLPTPVTNPFGTLPAMPVMSIGRGGASPSIQYGISTMPVSEKPIQVRTSAFLVPRHISQRRIKLPPRKFIPKADGLMVPFYSENGDAPSTPKADALFIRRENPRALIVRPIEQWPPRNGNDKTNITKHGNMIEPSAPVFDETYEREDERNPKQNGHVRENDAIPKDHVEKVNGVHNGDVQNGANSPYAKILGHRAAEVTNGYEHGESIEAKMPKLHHTDYYTEPSIQELAAKERAEPGFCGRVKDFVVGRHGYGCIKFFGETDVRRLDLESVVQLNNREVIVYMDETKKPPVGLGLNKPAEVTLLNIKCVNKKTGKQYTEGPMVENYKELLLKKTQEQGAEFLSYDALKGEWKFKVEHFSCYEFVKIDEDGSES